MTSQPQPVRAPAGRLVAIAAHAHSTPHPAHARAVPVARTPIRVAGAGQHLLRTGAVSLCLLVAAAAMLPDPVRAQTASGSAPSLAPALAPVEVRAGSARPDSIRASVGAIGDSPLAETPQSVSVIRAEGLRDAGAASLSSAIRGETSAGDFYNTTGYVESLQVRGFLLDNALNYRRDGMPVSNHMPLALENKTGIEILRGVAGMQAGVSAPGGLVNYVLKRPTATPLRELHFGLSERGTTLLHGDAGGRSGADGIFGYRINAALEERRPEARNAPGAREFASGFFDLKLPRGWLVEAEFESQTSRQISVPGYGLLGGTTLPAPIDPRINLNAQPWSQPFETRSLTGSLRLQKSLAEHWLGGVRVGSQRIRTNDRLAFPDGCYRDNVYPGMCNDYAMDLYDFRSEHERRSMRSAEVYLKGEFTAAGLRHELSAGIVRSEYDERYDRLQTYNWVGEVRVFSPTVLAAQPLPGGFDFNTLRSARSTETYLNDVIRLSPTWSLWMGVRHTQLDRSSVRTDESDPQAVAYSQQFTTPWAALGWQAWAGGFVYASAGQGVESEFVPNRASRFSNPGQVLPALRSRQFEAGVKQKLEGGGLASAALFEIDRPMSDDIEQPAGSPPLRVAGARELRHRGLELALATRLAPAWTVAAQATLLDARTTRAADPTLIGKHTPNTAPLVMSGLLSWAVPEVTGLSWQNRLSWSDRKPVTRDNSVELPAWWQLDTAVVWRQREGARQLTWRAGIDNVFDRHYWRDAPTTYWGGTYLFAAAPRTLRLSVTAGF